MCPITGASAQECSAFIPHLPSENTIKQKLLSNQKLRPSPCKRYLARSLNSVNDFSSRITYKNKTAGRKLIHHCICKTRIRKHKSSSLWMQYFIHKWDQNSIIIARNSNHPYYRKYTVQFSVSGTPITTSETSSWVFQRFMT